MTTSNRESEWEKIEVIIARHRPIENFEVVETCAYEIGDFIRENFISKREIEEATESLKRTSPPEFTETPRLINGSYSRGLTDLHTRLLAPKDE